MSEGTRPRWMGALCLIRRREVRHSQVHALCSVTALASMPWRANPLLGRARIALIETAPDRLIANLEDAKAEKARKIFISF